MGKVGGQVVMGVSAAVMLMWMTLMALPYWHVKHQQSMLGSFSRNKFPPTSFYAGLGQITIVKNSGTDHEEIISKSFRMFQNEYCNDLVKNVYWGKANCDRLAQGESASMFFIMMLACGLIMMLVSDALLAVYWTKEPKPKLRMWGCLLKAVAAGCTVLGVGVYGGLTANMWDFTSDIPMFGIVSGMGNGEGMNFGYCFILAAVLSILNCVVAILAYTIMGKHSMEFAEKKEKADLQAEFGSAPKGAESYGAAQNMGAPIYQTQADPYGPPVGMMGQPAAFGAGAGGHIGAANPYGAY